MHRLLADLRTFDDGGGWADQGARSCAHWLSWRVGWGPGTAREHLRTAHALAKLPIVERELAHGRLSYSKVRANTRVATPANEQTLVEQAKLATASQLETICRKYQTVRRQDAAANAADDYDRRSVRRVDLAAETCGGVPAETCGDVPAETCRATSFEMPRPSAAHRTPPRPAFDRADALVALAQAYLRGDAPERTPVDVIVAVPMETLACGAAREPTDVACARDGTCISAHGARRLACDAGIVELVEDEHGNPLNVGRKTRSIPGAIKRALLARDGHRCRFPGCTNAVYLEGHHIEHWAEGGETSLENLVITCSFHHRFLHEYEYTVQLDADGTPIFRNEHGRVVPAVPPPAAPRELGWESILARNQRLAISATTNEPQWDGYPVDYANAIDDLVVADGLC